MALRIQGLPAADLRSLIQSRTNPGGIEETLDQFIINIAEGVFTIENCEIEYIAACAYRVLEKDQLNGNDLKFLTKLIHATSIHSQLQEGYPDILESAVEYASALVA